MVSEKLEAKQTEVFDFDWFKTDHRAVLAVLSLRSCLRHSAKHAVNLRGWNPNDEWQKAATGTLTGWRNWDALTTPALGDSTGAQNGGDQGDDCVRIGAQNSSVRASRVEQILPCHLAKRRALKREKHLTKITKKTQSKHFNSSSIAKQKNPETVLTSLFQDLCSIAADQLDLAQAERITG